MGKNTALSKQSSYTKPTGLERKLESLCRKACHEFSLIDSNEKEIAVALSGGKDSITLLYMLHQIKNRGFANFKITAIHIAGEFSCCAGVSTSYVKKICDELVVPLIIKENNIPLERLSCYPCARMRRRMLFDSAKEVGITKIAFGHHKDDSVETLLMNLFQKAEFEANLPLVPMIDYGVTIIRPLIYANESLIKEYAKQKGFARIACQCPVGQKSKRKEIKEFIKQIERHYPNVKTNLAQAASQYSFKKALKKS